MLDSQLSMLSYHATYTMFDGTSPGPQGTDHDSVPTYRAFTGSDGRTFVVTAMTDRMWQALCVVIGRPELVDDPRFVDGGTRLANRPALWSILERAFVQRPSQYWIDELLVQQVPAALIKTVGEALADAEDAGRGLVYESRGAGDRPVRLVGSPVRSIDDAPFTAAHPPHLGQHTEDILEHELGLGPDEVKALRSAGIVR